jgi:hypothetical protein
MLHNKHSPDKPFARRIPLVPREAAAIIKLRRNFRYTINVLAKVFGRSTSIIHRLLKFNTDLGALRKVDLRRIPTRVKKIGSARQEATLYRFLDAWVKWISSEEEKPP